jgi:hypothetical protein
MIKTSFIKKSERTNELLGLIHTNIYRSLMICALGGCTYFITFTDIHFVCDYVY